MHQPFMKPEVDYCLLVHSSDHYPFFKPDDDRWKNSVRHNLSINPYFKKGDKARSGAGHLWTISEESRALRPASVSCLSDLI